MFRENNGVSRRNVLKLAGGSLATLSATGLAAAKPDDTVEVNVGFASDRGRKAAIDAASEVVRGFNTLDIVTLRAPKRAATALESNPNVRYVEANETVEALAQTLPWGIDRVDAEVAHANGDTGAGADIAIIDTGIDSMHADLYDNLGEGRAFTGGVESSNWHDDNGHGTHCAGIADAVDDDSGVVGVSTEATLHAVKVLTAAGTGTTSDVAAGIEYVGDKGWDVGSLSLGGGSTETLRDAVEYAHGEGVLLVAAAGNDGPCTDCVGYPAAYEEVVAVSSTNEDDELSDFSSQGPEVEIAAPGTDIYSTYTGGSYATLSGTSMACPHVSGAGGQLMANGYTHEEARSRLKDTAEDVGLSSNESGSGLLDAAAALGLDSSDDL